MARIPGLQVIRSPVAGYGVISTRRRKKGSVICNVEGVMWRTGERTDDTHSLILEDGIFFDMVDQTRWLNHSCDPNVVIEAGITKSGNGWAQLQALRDIEPGEELFFDYALPEALKEKCYCGAKNCRGWIVQPDAPSVSTSRSRERDKKRVLSSSAGTNAASKMSAKTRKPASSQPGTKVAKAKRSA